MVFFGGSWWALAKTHENLDDPETVLRMIVKVNAEMDLKTLETQMAVDDDTVGYTIGGRKYIGWKDVKTSLQRRVFYAQRINHWYSQSQGLAKGRGRLVRYGDIDCKREVQTADGPKEKTGPLRDTGVLNRREGKWMLVNWHESMREPIKPLAVKREAKSTEAGANPGEVNLTGEWEIQKEDKAYQVTLDATGNGPYA
jgi:hypothetical protein